MDALGKLFISQLEDIQRKRLRFALDDYVSGYHALLKKLMFRVAK